MANEQCTPEYKHDEYTKHLPKPNITIEAMGCTAWAGYLNASGLSSTGVSYPYLKVLHLFFSKTTVMQIQYVLYAVPKQLSFKASGRKRGSIIDVLLPSPPLSMIMLEKDFRTVSSRICNSYLRIDPS